jgi:hypothetical protein
MTPETAPATVTALTIAPAPDPVPDTDPADQRPVPAPDAAHAPTHETDTAPEPQAPAEPPTITVRRAAAQALSRVAETVNDETSIAGLLTAIIEQARACGKANGLAPGSWNHGRVAAMAQLALFATTVTTAEAENALRERLRHLSISEIGRHLTGAADFLQP